MAIIKHSLFSVFLTILKTNLITLCVLFKFSHYENVISVNILEVCWMLGIFCVHPSSAFEERSQSAAVFPCVMACG